MPIWYSVGKFEHNQIKITSGLSWCVWFIPYSFAFVAVSPVHRAAVIHAVVPITEERCFL